MSDTVLGWLFGGSNGTPDGRRGRVRQERDTTVAVSVNRLAGGDERQVRDSYDANLVTRIRREDSHAFAELYDLYFKELLAFAFRYVRNQAAAEDIVHDVFLKLWSIRSNLEIRTTLRAFLFSIAANHARNAAAQVRRQGAILSPGIREEIHSGENTNSPQDGIETSEARRIIRAAVASLPERQRLAITLRLAKDMTYDEIATVLGITKSSVAKLISKAQAHLRRFLGPE